MRLIELDEVRFKMTKYGFKAPDMTIHEFVEDELDTIDAVPVVHGKWIKPHWLNSDYAYNCSICFKEAIHRVFRWREQGIYPICPNCGADMREVEAE